MIRNIIMCENINNCCRICLDVETDHVSILENPTIQMHIKSCLTITVSNIDDLPKTICGSCVSQLGIFYHFQLNARCSQEWLESCIQEKSKKSVESKTPVQPLPDCEYNSDSLLEFLNNTANIEEYLSSLGKEDIPCIVNMLDKNNENSLDPSKSSNIKTTVLLSSNEFEDNECNINMEVDILDSDAEIVKEILLKETEPKIKPNKSKIAECIPLTCFSCETPFENLQKLSHHMSICDMALRTCVKCKSLFDSRRKMLQHRITHVEAFPTNCDCGKLFTNREKLSLHYKHCVTDYIGSLGGIYRCKSCLLMFRDRMQLFRHAKAHSKNVEMKVCDTCSHNFIDDDALATHKQNVHGEYPNSLYRCKVCSYTSESKKVMYLHVRKHTQAKEPQLHLCESCGGSFSTRSILTRHLQTHKKQNKIDNPLSEKPDACIKTNNFNSTIICEKCGLWVKQNLLQSHLCLESNK